MTYKTPDDWNEALKEKQNQAIKQFNKMDKNSFLEAMYLLTKYMKNKKPTNKTIRQKEKKK